MLSEVKSALGKGFTYTSHNVKNAAAPLLKRCSLYAPREVPIRYDGLHTIMLGDWTGNCGIGTDYPQHQCHEPIVTRAVIETLEKTDSGVLWDVGSAYGYYGIVSMEKTTPRNIHLFEPDKIASSFLKKNNNRYAGGQMNVNEVPVGSAEDSLNLDEYCAEHGCPDIIKIDVDGQEEDILSTMTQTIDDCQPELLIEIHFSSGYSKRREAIINLLSDSIYEFRISLRHRDRYADWTEIDSLSHLPNIEELHEKESKLLGADYILRGTPI